MTKEEIMLLVPGPELDDAVGECDEGFSPSTDMDDAWELRETMIAETDCVITIEKYCDEFPEYCVIKKDDEKVEVWAKTPPEAICKAIKLWNEGHRGDCHPWTLFPEKMKLWCETWASAAG